MNGYLKFTRNAAYGYRGLGNHCILVTSLVSSALIGKNILFLTSNNIKVVTKQNTMDFDLNTSISTCFHIVYRCVLKMHWS